MEPAIEELMITEIARQVQNGDWVAVGTLSPIPAAGVLLALMTTAPQSEAFIWMMPGYWPFTEGVKEFFDTAARGDVNLFFLGGAQIDRQANTNLNCIGKWEQPKVRLPGGAGTGTLYSTVERVVLFSERHDTRTFVANVDFITGCGTPPANVFRRGGPTHCITPLGVLSFDTRRKGWNLSSLHPGISLETVKERTGFPFLKETRESTTAPTREQLTLLRGPVKEKLALAYPRFVKQLWG